MKPVRLSHFLKKDSVPGDRIELNFKEIDVIDALNFKLGNVTHLDLSFNNLTTLDGIEQFTNLVYLNLANNLLRNLQCLSKVCRKEILSVVCIKGNPAARHPNLIPIIINHFPNIREIDGEVLNYSTQKDIIQAMELSSSLIPYLYINEQLILKIHKEIQFINLKLELFDYTWSRLPKAYLPSNSEIIALNLKLSQKYKDISIQPFEGKIRPITVIEYMQRVQDQLNINSAHLEEETVCKIYRWLYCEIVLYMHSQGNVDLQCFLQSYEETSFDSDASSKKLDGITSDLLKFTQLSPYPQSLLHFPVFGCNSEYMRALYSVLNKQISTLSSLIKERRSSLISDFNEACDEIQSPPSKISYPSFPSQEYCSPSVLRDLVTTSFKSPSNLLLDTQQFLSPKFNQDSNKSEKKIDLEFMKDEVVSKLDFEDESDMNITTSFEELSQTIEDLLRDDDREEEKFKEVYQKKLTGKVFKALREECLVGKLERRRRYRKMLRVWEAWREMMGNEKADMDGGEQKALRFYKGKSKGILKAIVMQWRKVVVGFIRKKNDIADYFYQNTLKKKSILCLKTLIEQKIRNHSLSDQLRRYSLLRSGFTLLHNYITVYVARKNKIRQHRIRSMKTFLKKLLKSWLYLVRPSAKFIKKPSQGSTSQADRLLKKLQQKDKEIVKTFKKYKKTLKKS